MPALARVPVPVLVLVAAVAVEEDPTLVLLFVDALGLMPCKRFKAPTAQNQKPNPGDGKGHSSPGPQ